MQTNTSPNKLTKKSSTMQIIMAATALILFGSGYCVAQSTNIQTNYVAPVYLKKTDPIFTSIKDRAITDLQQSMLRADADSSENKLRATQIKAWPQEKQDQLQVLGRKSIEEYTAQTHFDVSTFWMVFSSSLGKMDKKKIAKEYDIRIQNVGGDKYAAEFWEDGLAVNSEANAVIWAHELAASPFAKKHPNDKVGDVDVIKQAYANTRKSINKGKQERYTKVMALLYTQEKNGSITFHDPMQPMYDFK